MKRIGVLTSGGDAPGMNAAIRAVVRTAIYNGLEVYGIKHGYTGLIDGQFEKMNVLSVGNIIQRGGTILKTTRSEEFKTFTGRKIAAQRLEEFKIEGLVAIGGDGTFRGACELHKEWGIKIIGIPGTIDNDLYGTDYTIGFDTAVNTAVECIDKIKDTAQSLERIFFVEVMGRASGFIAFDAGIAGGAEEIIIPETKTDLKELWHKLKAGIDRGKLSNIILVAEGDEAGGALDIAKKFREISGIDYRVTILGHIQRGGSPTAYDRLLASKLGVRAVDCFLQGKHNIMVGDVGRKIVETPLHLTWEMKKKFDPALQHMARILAT